MNWIYVMLISICNAVFGCLQIENFSVLRRRQMDLLHAGLERLDQGMALISGDCSIEYANSAFRKLVGLNKEMKKCKH